MIPECRGCHRKRMDGEWRDLPDIQAAVMGWCPECLRAEEQRQRSEYARLFWAAQARKARGFGPAPEGVDVFVA